LKKLLLTATLVALLVISSYGLVSPVSAQTEPINVIIIWHFHQPPYFDPEQNVYLLPWVRIHSVANYYKMAYILSNYADVKVTFTFTGSLMEQINDYVVNNRTDVREDISIKIADNITLTVDEKFSMLQVPGGFFDINWNRIVTQFLRYNALKIKRDSRFNLYKDLPLDQMKVNVVAGFTAQDLIDLATLFNLLWIDPELENADPVLANMRTRANTANPAYNRTELTYVLQKQREIMGLVIPKHKELQDRNQTEIIPSPYSHPIDALLADFGWETDLDGQIKKGVEIYETFFNKTPIGMWSPEMAVNEAAMRKMAENNILWTATDENILDLAGVDISNRSNVYTGYKVNVTPNINILFRDTDLSNAIGFQYSGRTTADAVADFRDRLLTIQQDNFDPKTVVTIALDGENPWESYINNGDDFLHALYANLTQLQTEGKIRTTTPKEYFTTYTIDRFVPTTQQQVINVADVDISNITKYENLPFETKSQAIPEGSWSGKDLRLQIWIGDKQENVAYMWLKKARETLIQYNASHPGWLNYTLAITYLYRAEASDWAYWYGNDAGNPVPFDPIYKVQLRTVYNAMMEPLPDYLNAKFLPDGQPVAVIQAKPKLAAPTIDGKMTGDEWAGNFTLAVQGTWIDNVLFLNDYQNLYLSIVPPSGVDLKASFGKELFIAVYSSSPEISYSPYNLQYNVWARYQTLRNQTLGFALYTEVGIWFNITTQTNQKYTLSHADGAGNFVTVSESTIIAIDETIELNISFASLTLQPKDITYLAITASENQTLVDISSKIDTPVALQVASTPVWGQIIFNWPDSAGDDYGPGTYVYPSSYEFISGVFDMLNFTASKLDDADMFKIRFAAIGDNPWNGPYGFCIQFVHIYIDKDRVDGSGRTDTLGARLNVSSSDGWEVALSIGGGFTGGNLITFANGTTVSGDMTIELEGDDTVVARVPISRIGEINETWRYVVLSLSWDGYSPNNIRGVGAGNPQAYLGGGADSDAVIAGVQPYTYDILVPEGKNQTDVLKSYSITPPKYATVYAVGPAAVGPPPEGGPPIPLEWIIAIVIIVVVVILAAALLIFRRRRVKK